jgi:vitamin B12/bleomycin/antimicrobial peptide transport system ATP-binding/permease protein
LEKFTPSLDWGHELIASPIWIAKAWGISAVCVVVVVMLVGRFTTWGRQYWRITGAYFKGRPSLPVWLLLSVLLLSTMISVRLSVLLSFQGNDMLSAVQAALQGLSGHDDDIKSSGVHGFWFSIVVFGFLATVNVVQVMLDLYLMQRFIIRWRVWLTERLTADWLQGRAYYRTRFLEDTIDNPDQRIQLDIDIFTTGTGQNPNTPTIGTSDTLLFGAVNSMVTVVSFTAILWNLSGPLSLLGVTLPRAMFWIALAYVAFATVFAFWIGRPLIQLSFLNELTNAAFRYGLVRLRDAAEAVGFYRGEDAERATLRTQFTAIIANYRRYLRRTIAFTGWNLSAGQVITPLPYIVQAPRLFAGAIQLGDITQSASAFGNISSGLSFFRNSYDSFASFRATILRLHGLINADAQAREMPTVTIAPSADGSVELSSVEVRTPTGTQLIDPLDLHLTPGDTLVVTGPSGSGKTTLLRSLAELWPFSSGTARLPDNEHATMFLSQLPYVPLGDLRAVVSYPAKTGEITDEALKAALEKVALAHLGSRLDEVQDWAKVLSPGEQQRIAFARLILMKPKAAFLDEATSALDEGLQFALYQLLRSELPDSIVVSVTHRSTVEQHHEQELKLLGDGAWQLCLVGDDQEP